MDKILSRADIDSADDRKTKKVPVPEWGGFVLIRQLSVQEREAVERIYDEQKSFNALMAVYVAGSLVDSNGALLYSPEEVDVLRQKSADVVNRIYDECTAFNGVDSKGNGEGSPTGSGSSTD